jgi:class 3 adenylate cyclase/HAMP domain-containing protein
MSGETMSASQPDRNARKGQGSQAFASERRLSEKRTLEQPAVTSQPSAERRARWCSRQSWSNLWTVQNVITCVNVAVLTFAVLFISLLSYFLSVASTFSAIEAISLSSIFKVQFALNDTLQSAVLLNSYITSTFQLEPQGFTDLNMIAHELAYVIQDEPVIFQALHTSQLNPNNVSDQAFVLAGSQTSGPVDMLRFAGDFSNFTLLEFPLSSTCQLLNFSCTLANTSTLLAPPTPFNLTTRPYYIDANEAGGPIWTALYQLAPGIIGLTASTPVMQMASNGQNVAVFLSNVDLTISSISVLLFNVTQTIANDSNLRIFIVDRNPPGPLPPGCPTTGLLVTTNLPSLEAQIQNETCPRQAVNSSDPIIDMTANAIISRYGNWSNIQQSEAVFSANGYEIVFEAFEFGPPPNNISWFLVIAIPYAIFFNQINTLYRIIIPIIAPCIVLLGALASFFLTRYIIRPLKKLTEQLLTVANLDFDKITPTESTDRLQLKEISRINRAVFTMMGGLKSFAKYVPQDVVKMLLKMRREAVLGVEEIELTIYFSDIADFTSISEDLDPESLVTLMSEYLQEMSSIILERQGIVDKYIGDAVMAFWNAPVPVPNHSAVGCEVALMTQWRLRELQEKWITQNYPIVRVRVGVNSGVALVGNLGSSERLSYTCIGDNVDLASRLEGLNKIYGTDILISEAVYVKVNDIYVTRLLETIQTKRMDWVTRIYELVCSKSDVPEEILTRVELYERAMQRYYEKDFETAKNLFQQYLQLIPGDLGASRHISSCDAFIAKPPSTDWKGIIKLLN